MDARALAEELLSAYSEGTPVASAPSARESDFNLGSAYAVEAEIARLRQAAGHRPVGLKVGFANKAVWRALKLETLVWGSMYDDTVSDASGGAAALSIGSMIAPKIEPELVLKLARPLELGDGGAAPTAEAVL